LICDTHITAAPRQLGYTATAANNQTRRTCISTAAWLACPPSSLKIYRLQWLYGEML